MMNRRNFIRSSAACSALLATGPAWIGKTAYKTPVRITEGPSGHWFGYYDKWQVDPSGNSSHFVWRDPENIFVWTRPMGKQAGFWLLKDKTEEMELIGEEAMDRNGHNTYVPHTNEEWVLNDTYPDKERLITLYLYHIPSNKKVILGKFHSPERFVGEWRCDLHPRCDQQGRRVFFDSTHEGSRQMYYLDISDIVGT